MIRLILRRENCSAATDVSGAIAHVTYHTFDIDLPELQRLLRADGDTSAQVVGAEVLKP